MRSILLSGALAVLLVPIGESGSAQTPAQALSEARARLVCGAGQLVDATYLPGGSLQVTCRQSTQQTQSQATTTTSTTGTLPNALAGTGLTTGAAAALGAAALVVIVVAAGGGDGSTSTTTTTTTTTSTFRD